MLISVINGKVHFHMQQRHLWYFDCFDVPMLRFAHPYWSNSSKFILVKHVRKCQSLLWKFSVYSHYWYVRICSLLVVVRVASHHFCNFWCIKPFYQLNTFRSLCVSFTNNHTRCLLWIIKSFSNRCFLNHVFERTGCIIIVLFESSLRNAIPCKTLYVSVVSLGTWVVRVWDIPVKPKVYGIRKVCPSRSLCSCGSFSCTGLGILCCFRCLIVCVQLSIRSLRNLDGMIPTDVKSPEERLHRPCSTQDTGTLETWPGLSITGWFNTRSCFPPANTSESKISAISELVFSASKKGTVSEVNSRIETFEESTILLLGSLLL